MADEPVKVGIVGAGNIANAHAQGFSKVTDRCRVVAVAEANPGRDQWIHERFGPDVRIVREYHELLAMPEVQGVDILLPHHLHMPAAIHAAEAGKHVLIEKVMARNVWECDRMIEACDRAGVSLTICHDRRYNGEWMALKEVLELGVIGEPFFWKLDHNQDVKVPQDSWIYWKDAIGGGSIMSCLTHQIDGLRWYGGEVDQVTCLSVTRPERMEGEFAGVVVGKMRSGALAELSINWWTRSHNGPDSLWYEMVQVCGTKGEAYRMSGRGTFVRLHEADDAAVARFGAEVTKGFVQVPSGAWGGHERCIAEWVSMLRGESANLTTAGRDCRGTVEVAEAAYRSIETGRTIALPIEPKPWEPVGMPEKFMGAGGPDRAKVNYHVDVGRESSSKS